MIDCYEKLTIGKYDELMVIMDGDGTEYEKKVEVVALLNDMEIEDVEALPLVTYNTLLQSTAFLYENPKKKMVADKYVLGGKEFELMMDMKKMTVSQYIDYQMFIKEVDKYTVELLSIFLIPKGCKYNDGYDIVEVQKIIRDNLCILDAKAMTDFFLLLFQSLTKATLRCFKRRLMWMKMTTRNMEKRKKMEEAIANLESVGNGLQWWTE